MERVESTAKGTKVSTPTLINRAYQSILNVLRQPYLDLPVAVIQGGFNFVSTLVKGTIFRPSVITGLTVGATIAATATVAPIALASWALGTAVGIETIRSARAHFALKLAWQSKPNIILALVEGPAMDLGNTLARPSVVTALVLGVAVALLAPISPLAIAACAVGTMAGIEAFGSMRAVFASRLADSAIRSEALELYIIEEIDEKEEEKEIDIMKAKTEVTDIYYKRKDGKISSAHYKQGRLAESDWKGYLKASWVTFQPFGKASASFQIGRETERRVREVQALAGARAAARYVLTMRDSHLTYKYLEDFEQDFVFRVAGEKAEASWKGYLSTLRLPQTYLPFGEFSRTFQRARGRAQQKEVLGNANSKIENILRP